jgi:hypothetical protein
MVLLNDEVACKNLRCRKRFRISGVKTMAFPSAEGGLPRGESGTSHGDFIPR